MNSFTLPDLVIESVIRDGLANLRKTPSIIDNIFSSLTAPYNNRKYGSRELTRIKNLILKQDISVVHSFNNLATNVPCYSIQLGADAENKRQARLGDFEEDYQEEFTDPADLEDIIIKKNMTIQSYNPLSGQLSVDDAVDISNIRANHIFIDANGDEYIVKPGLSEEPGNQFFTIDKNLDPDISDVTEVRSSINFKQLEINGVTSDVQILMGVHTKDALMTKYLYVILKYILNSRRKILEKRCFAVSSFQGSDFTRNMEYQGDIVYTRFMTVMGQIEDSWNGDEVEPIEGVDISVVVPKDQASGSDLGEEDLTVKPNE